MKLTIDTDLKTIEFEGEVSIKDLQKTIKALIGDKADEYKIKAVTKKEIIPHYCPVDNTPYWLRPIGSTSTLNVPKWTELIGITNPENVPNPVTL